MNFTIVNIFLTLLLSIVCVFIAYTLTFTDGIEQVRGNNRLILTIILIGYSIFRGFRAVKMWKER